MTTDERSSNETLYDTLEVPYDGILRGVGSKQITLTAEHNDTIIKVQPNWGMWCYTAIIENLIIERAAGYAGILKAGILLEDVYRCLIRNVVIKNCFIGIKITATAGKWSESNNIQHVRMINVKKGILFDKGVGNEETSFGFTKISNVGISLKAEQNLTGIYIDNGCKPYASFIKANVWMTEPCYGMCIDGEVKYGLVNLNVEKTAGPRGGKGVTFWEHGESSCNQSFFLSTGNIEKPIFNPFSRPCDISNPDCANY